MNPRRTLAAVVGVLLAVATAAHAQQSPAAPPSQAQAPGVYGSELMTPEERDAFRKQMQAAKTPDERARLREAHRAEMDQRAKARGVTLAHPGKPAPQAGRPQARQSQLYGDELFTPEERQAFFDRMQAAQTPEARAQLVLERRAVADARAKEKGIALPAPRGPQAGPKGPGTPKPR